MNLTWTILAGDTVTLKLRPGVSMALDAGTTIVGQSSTLGKQTPLIASSWPQEHRFVFMGYPERYSEGRGVCN